MKTVLLCALLVYLVAVSAAIDNCYNCLDCGDPFDPTGVPDACPDVFGLSYKYCAKVEANGAVARSCAPACVEGCVSDICTYCCETDLCNGGTAVKTSFVAMGMALLTVFIFSKE